MRWLKRWDRRNTNEDYVAQPERDLYEVHPIDSGVDPDPDKRWLGLRQWINEEGPAHDDSRYDLSEAAAVRDKDLINKERLPLGTSRVGDRLVSEHGVDTTEQRMRLKINALIPQLQSSLAKVETIIKEYEAA